MPESRERFASTHVSPDGQWLALHNVFEPQEDIFIMRRDGSALTRLTNDNARDRWPRFTPDGKRLFAGGRITTGPWPATDRTSTKLPRLELGGNSLALTAWSPDGRTLYYGAAQLSANIWMVKRNGVAAKQ